ncbi:MAG: transposase [Gemmatimonadaceae bacterium]|nr:transposase [Gemmatimonadaceae bacterium]
MARAGPRKIRKYSDTFKLTAVRMSQQPGMQVKTVAVGLDIHPFMRSRWRKEVRDGVLRGRLPRRAPAGPTRELVQL